MISRCPLALFLLVACAAPADAGLRGRGLISVDRAAPASVERVERPEWKLGDRFVYRRGGKIRLEYLLTEKSDQGYVLEEVGSQLEFSLGLDLERKAEAAPNRSTEVRHFAPADHVLTWPLWVGKRWSGEYALEMPGAEPMLVLASYTCDARERITVPAGSFDCFRIWRRSQPLIEGSYLDKVSLLWYAPEVGNFVRRLEDNAVTELESFHRQ